MGQIICLTSPIESLIRIAKIPQGKGGKGPTRYARILDDMGCRRTAFLGIVEDNALLRVFSGQGKLPAKVHGLGKPMMSPQETSRIISPAGQAEALFGQLTPRLAGFLSAAEREFFLRYIKAPGLSPRSAIRSLILPPERIAAAIAGGSLAVLTKLPGIGKKKAEQIISKLQEKIAEIALGAETAPANPRPPKIDRPRAEAMGVLVGQLGYRTPEAEDLIERAAASLGEEATTEGILQEVFRLSR